MELDINADKSKYKFKSREQNTGQGKSLIIENISFERVEDFRKELSISSLSSERI